MPRRCSSATLVSGTPINLSIYLSIYISFNLSMYVSVYPIDVLWVEATLDCSRDQATLGLRLMPANEGGLARDIPNVRWRGEVPSRLW